MSRAKPSWCVASGYLSHGRLVGTVGLHGRRYRYIYVCVCVIIFLKILVLVFHIDMLCNRHGKLSRCR